MSMRAILLPKHRSCPLSRILIVFVTLLPKATYALEFDAPVSPAVGNAPLGTAVADLDDDGKDDLVVAALEDDRIAVFRSSGLPGTISFDPRATFTTGPHPQGVLIADLDKDGKPDVVTANSGRGGGGGITVFHNESTPGVITLVRRVDRPVDTAHRVAAGDFDRDGRLDLAVTGNSPRLIAIFRNTSSPGTLGFSRVLDLLTAGFAHPVGVADVDGDEKPDVLVPITDTDKLYIYLNSSTGNLIAFDFPADFPVGDTPDHVAIADLDDNGKPDLIVNNRLSHSLTVYFNNSSPGTLSLTREDFPAGFQPGEIAIGDLDGIDRVELVVANSSSDKLTILRVVPDSLGIDLEPVLTLDTGSLPIVPAVGDVDGDGALDLAVGNHGGITASVFRNTGTGFLGFPLPGLAPLTAPISAILDHSVVSGYYCRDTHLRDDTCSPGAPPVCERSSAARSCFMVGDGIIRAFSGTEGRSEFLSGRDCGVQCGTTNRLTCNALYTTCGYPKSSRGLFTRDELGGVNYVGVSSQGGARFLQYDGHSGYDYPAARGTAIVAPLSGRIVRPAEDRINGGISGGVRSFNTFKIVHAARDGFIYETWYLHAERGSVVADGDVHEGEKIAAVSCTGLESEGRCPSHLHFEVRRYPVAGDPVNDSELVDPYAEGLWK